MVAIVERERVVRLHITLLPEGVYLATSEDVQGLVAQGRTVAETVEIARDVARKLLEAQSNLHLPKVKQNFDYPLIIGGDQFRMGRLSGFKFRQIVKKCKAFGFEFFRNAAGSHEIWHHPVTGRFTTIQTILAICLKGL